MNFEFYIAKRITFKSKRTFSRTIIRIAIAAIALSISIMLVSIAIVKGFQSEIKNKVIGFGTHIQISITNINYTFENEPVIYNQELCKSITDLETVKNIQVYATKPGIIKTDEAIEGVVLKGVSDDYDWTYIENNLVQGNVINFNDSVTSNDMIISKTLAKKLNLKINDRIIIYFVQDPPRVRKLRICGIYETGIEDIDNIFSLCDIRHIKKLNNWSDSMIGGYEVNLHDINDMEETNEQIRYMVNFDEDAKTIKQLYPQIFDWLDLLNVNVRIILILMTIVASVNMVTALLIIILEKTQMIGVLKAFGARNHSISRIFLINSSFLIVFGIIIGNIIGLGLIYLQDTFEIIKLSPESYYVNSVPVMFKWRHFLLLNVGTFVFCTLIMYFPSRFISKVNPVKALRFE